MSWEATSSKVFNSPWVGAGKTSLIQKSESKMLWNWKLFEHWHDAHKVLDLGNISDFRVWD
jgi:hypothetical protein